MGANWQAIKATIKMVNSRAARHRCLNTDTPLPTMNRALLLKRYNSLTSSRRYLLSRRSRLRHWASASCTKGLPSLVPATKMQSLKKRAGFFLTEMLMLPSSKLKVIESNKSSHSHKLPPNKSTIQTTL